MSYQWSSEHHFGVWILTLYFEVLLLNKSLLGFLSISDKLSHLSLFLVILLFLLWIVYFFLEMLLDVSVVTLSLYLLFEWFIIFVFLLLICVFICGIRLLCFYSVWQFLSFNYFVYLHLMELLIWFHLRLQSCYLASRSICFFDFSFPIFCFIFHHSNNVLLFHCNFYVRFLLVCFCFYFLIGCART